MALFGSVSLIAGIIGLIVLFRGQRRRPGAKRLE